jgi:WD repeat-containing protein 26
LELLEDNKVQDAINVLQNDLAPLQIFTDELHRLSRLLLLSNPTQIRSKANWDGKSGQSRSNLLAVLSSNFAY